MCKALSSELSLNLFFLFMIVNLNAPFLSDMAIIRIIRLSFSSPLYFTIDKSINVCIIVYIET